MIKDNCVYIIFYYIDEMFFIIGYLGNYFNLVGWVWYLS